MADTVNTIKNRVQDVKDQVGQAAAGAAETVRNAANDFGNRAQGFVSDAQSRAQGFVSDAQTRAQGFVSDAQQRASAAGEYVSQQMEDATSMVGDRLRQAGSTIRQQVPQNSNFSQAGEAVAGSLESTGDYLKRQGFRGLESDLVALVKNNPIPSILIGVGVGFILARAMTSRD